MDAGNLGPQRDRNKKRRVVLQLVVLAAGLFLLGRATINLPQGRPVIVTPTPPAYRLGLITQPPLVSDLSSSPAPEALSTMTGKAVQRDRGFVALSYVGVGPKEGETIISDVRLAKHLRALKERGFETISQDDLYRYYYQGGSLPERSLFLFFEDGRMQSARLAHPMLQKLDYTASMLSYANTLVDRDPLFLTGTELSILEKTGNWELGTNGYRLSYINVFDRHENYLGEMTPVEFQYVAPYIRREYDHFLMDFVRDKNDIPTESLEQMQARIGNDYKLMDQVYRAETGSLPMLYTLMHSNTGQFGTNATVSAENEKWIHSYFKLNFNREMHSVNTLNDSAFDLTRMQPQSYWSVNHLLMRIADDMGLLGEMPFELGNKQRAEAWTILQGAAEWDENTVRVTTLPEGEGRLRLNGSEQWSNYTVQVRLDGNKLGKQALELLADPDAHAYAAVELDRKTLRLYAGSAGNTTAEPLWELDMDLFDGVVHQTWEENRQEAMGVEIKQKISQSYLPAESRRIAADLIRAKADKSNTNEEAYIPDITLRDDGSRQLKLQVAEGKLTIWLDEREVLSAFALPVQATGGIALRSAWAQHGFSQRNLADDVYDGDFADLLILGANGKDILVDYRRPIAEPTGSVP